MSVMSVDNSRLKPFSLWQKAALFCAAYYLCAEAGSFLSAQDGTFVSFWLPAGLFLAVLLLNRTRDWPWLALAVLPANLAFDHFHGTKLIVILAFYCANIVQTVTGAWLMRRVVGGSPSLAHLQEFFGGVGFSRVFTAVLGAVPGP